MSVITVILKDSERTYRQKFLCYEAPTLSQDDAILRGYVKEAQSQAAFDPEDVTIRIQMEL